MAEVFDLTIQTPNLTVYNGKADAIHLKTDDGNMEVFAGHAPLQASIGFSRCRVREGEHEIQYLLRKGFIFVDPEEKIVRVMCFSATKAEDMDHVSAKEYMDAVLEALEKGDDLSAYQMKFLEEEKIAMGELLEETKQA